MSEAPLKTVIESKDALNSVSVQGILKEKCLKSNDVDSSDKVSDNRRVGGKSVKFCAQVEAQYFGDQIEEDQIRRSYYIQRTDPVVEELRKSLPVQATAPVVSGVQSAPAPRSSFSSLLDKLSRKLRSSSL